MADPESDLLESPSEGPYTPQAPTPLPVGSMAPSPLDYSRPQPPGAMPNALLDRLGPSAQLNQQIQGTFGERMAQQDRAHKAMLDRAQAVEQANRGVDEAYAIPRAQVPQRLQLQATPEQRIHEFLAPVDGESPQASIAKMINAMGLFAQMGGAVARGHAASGVQALSGALAGWNAGQVERAQLDFQKWQMETRKAIEEKHSEFQVYEAINNDRKMTIEERLQKAQMVAYEKGNYVLAEQFNLQGYDKALDHLQQERTHLDTVADRFSRVLAAAQERATQREFLTAQAKDKREWEEREKEKDREVKRELGAEKATEKRIAESDRLRDDWMKENTDFKKVRDAYGKLIASQAKKTPFSDTALIYNFMKLLDAGSVVRETEFEMAAKTGRLGDKVKNAFDRWQKGDKLTDEQTADLMGVVNRLWREQYTTYAEMETQFKAIATRGGLDVERAVPDLAGRLRPKDEAPSALPGAGAAAAKPTAAATAKPAGPGAGQILVFDPTGHPWYIPATTNLNDPQYKDWVRP